MLSLTALLEARGYVATMVATLRQLQKLTQERLHIAVISYVDREAQQQSLFVGALARAAAPLPLIILHAANQTGERDTCAPVYDASSIDTITVELDPERP